VSDKINDIKVDEAVAIIERRHKARVAVVFFMGFFLFGMGLTMFCQSFIDQGYSLTPPQFNQLHEASGIFNVISSRHLESLVVLDNINNRRYSCSGGGCSFENYYDTRGKQVKILAYEDYIYQIEVDNIIKLDYAYRVKYLKKNSKLGIKLLIPGVIVMSLVQIYKRRQRREANG
jgi:hypothetical protein